jgi:hypothetical protein
VTRRGSGGRPGARLFACARAFCSGLLAAVVLGLAGTARAADAPIAAPPPPLCDRLANAPWPRTALDRRTLLQQLEAARSLCNRHADFLAVLGAHWLEEGDPTRALLWLERALLLAPDLLGAQVDYALALLALGERAPRDELLQQWQGRADVPPPLLARLARASAPSLRAASGAGATPAETPARWAHAGEIELLAGHDSNLDQSPRLDEFVITPPGGPIAIPIEQRPRAGSATSVEASWQLGHSPAPGWVVQAGLQASGRHSPDEPGTDWWATRLAAGAALRLDGWRLQLQASGSWTQGPLGDPYRIGRLSLALERDGLGCHQRLALDHDRRADRSGGVNGGRILAAAWSALCPVGATGRWQLGLAVRAADDEAVDARRPGGRQRQWALALRALGPLGAGWRAELGLRLQHARDDEGYDPLLENGARRWLQPLQLGLELSRRADLGLWRDADWLLQFQVGRQRSNLAVFRYDLAGLYGGLRFRF